MNMPKHKKKQDISGETYTRKLISPILLRPIPKQCVSGSKQNSLIFYKQNVHSRINAQKRKHPKQLVFIAETPKPPKMHPDNLSILPAEDLNHNYLQEFEKLIGITEEKGEVLLLNQSFEELQSGNTGERDRQKLECINRRKQLESKSDEQKLKIKLEDLKKQKDELVVSNMQLKREVDQLSRVGRDSMMLKYLRSQLEDLRSEIKRIEKSGVGNPKQMTKYRSYKQISGCFV